MRALFTGLVAAMLVGCASLPHDDASVAPRDDKSAARPETASKLGARHAKPIKARKAKAVASVKYTGSTTASRAARAPAAERAKAAIAAMLEKPASAEFYNLKRAQKKLLHRTMDTICGYVRAKNGSGGTARAGMPFVYTVDDGEAYLVDGKSHVAASVHGALCK